MTRTLKSITGYVDNTIELAQRRLDGWKTDFEKNPMYAMRWADTAFENAANLEFYTRVQRFMQSEQMGGLTEEQVVEQIVQFAEAAHVRLCTNVPRSTSPSSNVAESYERAAAASFWLFVTKKS